MASYRVLLIAPPTAADAGQVREELDQASLSGIRWELNRPTAFAFALPTGGYKVRRVDLLEEEIRVFRNGRCIAWGIPVRANDTSAGTTEFQCLGLEWYLSKRRVGGQRVNYLPNPSFESWTNGWPDSWTQGTDTIESVSRITAPTAGITGNEFVRLSESRSVHTWTRTDGKNGAPPAHTHLARLHARSGRTLSGVGGKCDGRVIAAGDRILCTSQGDSALNGIWVAASGNWTRAGDYDSDGEIRTPGGHVKVTDGVEYAGTGWVATNTSPITVGTTGINYKQFAKTVVTPRATYLKAGVDLDVGEQRGSRWTASAFFCIRTLNKAPYKDRGLMLRLWNGTTGKTIRDSVFRITDSTNTGEWIEAKASVTIPKTIADPRLTVFLYGVDGVIDWDAAGLWYRSSVLRGETDLATAMRQLVLHAQDTAYGKTTLNIGVTGGPADQQTSAKFWHDEHQNILEALQGLAAGDGPDFSINEDTRTFTVHPTGRGTFKDQLALEVNRNIKSWDVIEDGEQVANTIFTLAPGEGPQRLEGYASHTGTLSGMQYEDVLPTRFSAKRLRYLFRRARVAAENRKQIRQLLSVVTYEGDGQPLIDLLEVGDTTNVRIKEGRVDINKAMRVYAMELDCVTDELSLRLHP